MQRVLVSANTERQLIFVSKALPCMTGFNNYYKIVVRDHVRVSKLLCTYRTWENT